MAKSKIHWYYGCGWGRAFSPDIATRQFRSDSTQNPDWYCVTCAKKARLALAKEQPIAVSFSSTVRRCTRCRSGAINPSDHGRTEGADLDLCDVCYWRKRAESASWPNPRPISEARETEILGYCPDIGWRRLSRIGRRWGLTGAEHIADYEPTHFLPLPPEVR
jgi:hypothetical protein